MLKIYSQLDFDMNIIDELNFNASEIKILLDEHSKLYDVTHIEFYNKTRSSAYIKVYKMNGCFCYRYSVYKFEAIMKWYSGITPNFKEINTV